MARIRIIKKRKNKLLPWTLFLVAIALLIVLFDNYTRTDEGLSIVEARAMANEPTVVYNVTESPVRGEMIYPAEVTTYLNLTADLDPDRMDMDHEFSHRAFSVLAKAVRATSEMVGLSDDPFFDEAMANVRGLADDITRHPEATNHADKLNEAAIQISEAFSRINRKAVREDNDLWQEQLWLTAAAIEPEVLTLEQERDVLRFLLASRNMLVELYQ